jgi:hypothetical protein
MIPDICIKKRLIGKSRMLFAGLCKGKPEHVNWWKLVEIRQKAA